MENVKLGTKEIEEIFDGLDVLADFAGGVLADGKVGVSDIDDLVSLATKFNVLSAAAQGASDAVAEGKDLDQAEVMMIVGRIYQVVSKFAQAKKA